MSWLRRLIVIAAILAIAGAAYTLARQPERPADPGPAAVRRVDRFDAGAAWALVRRQLRYGQRPAGSPRLRALARELVRRLPHGRFERVGSDRKLRNIVGVLPGRRPGIVIGAHYDTLAAPTGFVGANNGAAGSAIVVQLGRDLRRLHRPPGARQVVLALFDGEEPAQGLPEQAKDFYAVGLRGSKAYVQAHPGDTFAMVLLDYVGNRGLRLPMEATSTPALWSDVRAAADEVGAGTEFPPATGEAIIDDHTPFLRAGIPAVDLIDWSYDGHSLSDTIAQLSRASIDAVGETMIALVRHLDAS